jgi:hypothetical protein
MHQKKRPVVRQMAPVTIDDLTKNFYFYHLLNYYVDFACKALYSEVGLLRFYSHILEEKL